MTIEALIGDRFGRVIAEVRPTLDPVAWRLNKINRTKLTLAKTDPKATADILRYGNRVLIRFSEDVGLPNWGGIMDPPLTWTDRTVTVSCYGIEYLLQFRTTGRTRAFDSAPVGRIFFMALREAEQEQSMGITFGPIWTGGGVHYPRYHFKSLWWIIHDSLLRMENCDIRFVPKLADGHITFQAELYERLGEDKSDRIAFKEGLNIASGRLVEQGPILNEYAAIGAGTTWGEERKVSIGYDGVSAADYGIRQYSKVFSGVTQQTTLDRHARSQVETHSRPHTRITAIAVNKDPATFNQYDIGDRLGCVLPTFGFDGFDETIRILSREYDTIAGSCSLVLEQVKDVISSYRGRGGDDFIEE